MMFGMWGWGSHFDNAQSATFPIQHHPYCRTTAIMRLIKQSIERKTGTGSATLLPEEPEDMVSDSLSQLTMFVSWIYPRHIQQHLEH